MSFTFGGTSGDDITWIAGGYNHATATATFVYGWWYPTTLTATRGLWSVGATMGAEIDTTTDELRLRTDNTTDGQWTTSGVDLAINNWYFLAFWVTNDNTNGSTWYVWRGTVDTPPVEATVTVATARSGNYAGSTSVYVGNKGTGTLAFQGDIADVGFVTKGSAPTTADVFHLTAHGSAPITATKELLYQQHVLGAWQYGPRYLHQIPKTGVMTTTPTIQSTFIRLGPSAGPIVEWMAQQNGTQTRDVPTVNTTFPSTSNRGPREEFYGTALWPALSPAANPL